MTPTAVDSSLTIAPSNIPDCKPTGTAILNHATIADTVPHKSPQRFSVDDAFSDSGEDDAHLEFTSESIRMERGRAGMVDQMLADDHDDGSASICESIPPSQSSISTFNLDQEPGSEVDRNAHSPSQYHSMEESIHKGPGISSVTIEPDVEPTFPSVVIDLSKPPSQQVIIISEANGTTKSTDNRPRSSSSTSMSVSSQTRDVQTEPTSLNLPLPSKLSTTSMPAHVRQPSRTSGPSALEKVISKTRPAYLPPKPKDEDVRHLADWEKMMRQSRAAEEQRRRLQRERYLAREREIEESIHTWESSILPDWKAAVRNPTFRKLWWNGVPPKLRGVIWERAFGNALTLSKDTYRTCLSRAKHALSTGSFPTTTLNLMDSDIRSTLPSLNLFHPSTGPLYQDLKDLLCAWVVSRSDEGLGYIVGASKIAAMFLLNMPSQAAFVAMRNLLERHCLRSFYGGLSCREDVEAYYRIFDTLLADCMPKVYFNFKQHQVSPAAYLPEWLLPLFLDHLPLDACARLWDVIALEGDSFLFISALAVLASLEPRLFFPDRQELIDLLQGDNKAALEVARRDGRSLGSHKYDIYGLDEETLWAQIDTLQGWWKEKTWSRLIQRELPDL